MTSCDKLRGGANIHRSADLRMRKLTCSNVQVPITESIGYEEVTQGTETSKYLEEEKETSISYVAASERERGQTVA